MEPQPGAAAAGAAGPGETQRRPGRAPRTGVRGAPRGRSRGPAEGGGGAAQAREPPRPPVVAEPGQEELGPGGKPGTAAGVGGHPRSLPGWGRDRVRRPPPRPQPR